MSVVTSESQGATAIIRLNRPEARNAVSQELAEAIEAAVDDFEADDQLWTAVLTGNGPAFCAGADLKAISAGTGVRLGTKRSGFAGFVLHDRTKPVIAAVEGPAVAGGTEIVLACDLVVAGESASFGLPEVKRSLVAAAGGTVRLPRAVPLKVAMEIALTGDHVGAPRAYELGLVNQVCADGTALEHALALAERINANAPLAVRATRRAVLDGLTMDVAAGIAAAGALSGELAGTDDFAEGPRAFVEKRAPQWKGR
ncbi:MAG: crotonase/enoyl-CoA hydratase family protein [Acidimicrobiia bacterium]|nr:crotonase/enoyl-CoA hydratase family protein [Acidimicrobiia bacterium]